VSQEEILFDAEERMEKAIDVFRNSLTGIRTGRANPKLVEPIRVDAYGSATPLKQLAQVSAPEPQQIVIRPYDPSVIGDIEKAIIASNLGMAPQNDGRLIRLNVPALSTEVRRNMVSRIKELAEEAKVAIRNIRRDANKAADQGEKDKDLSEDERDKTKEEIQTLTKKYEDQATEMAKTREGEVMED